MWPGPGSHPSESRGSGPAPQARRSPAWPRGRLPLAGALTGAEWTLPGTAAHPAGAPHALPPLGTPGALSGRRAPGPAAARFRPAFCTSARARLGSRAVLTSQPSELGIPTSPSRCLLGSGAQGSRGPGRRLSVPGASPVHGVTKLGHTAGAWQD